MKTRKYLLIKVYLKASQNNLAIGENLPLLPLHKYFNSRLQHNKRLDARLKGLGVFISIWTPPAKGNHMNLASIQMLCSGIWMLLLNIKGQNLLALTQSC